MSLEMNFTKLDLTGSDALEKAARQSTAEVPYLREFRASVIARQTPVVGKNVRAYCVDVLTRGFFAVVSPISGEQIRSGSSFILNDKSVLFSFPEAPHFFVAMGDISRGYPICAACLLGPNLWMELEHTDWGFSQKHFAKAQALIRDLEWSPSQSSNRVCIVTGDSNFAHHAWNQLSAFEDLAESDLALPGLSPVGRNRSSGYAGRTSAQLEAFARRGARSPNR